MVHRFALVALLVALSGVAQAQTATPDIQQFKPVTDMQGFVLVHDATLLPRMRPGVGLNLNYAVNPLEVNAPGSGRQFGVMDGIFGVDITAAFAFFDWWEAGILFPIAQVPVATEFLSSPSVGGTAVKYGIGDVALSTRLRALDPKTNPVGIAGNFFLSLPTGTGSAGLGRGLPGGGGSFILSQAWTRFHFAFNVGAGFYSKATIANLSTEHEITYGLGLGFTPLVDKLDILVEFDGSLTPGPNDHDGTERFFDGPHSPLEMLVGVRAKLPHDLSIHGGIGKGLTSGFGTPDVRVFIGLSWAVFRPIDRDKDGIADPDDACRRDPEDIDGFEDLDGCPDPDNDADGIPDTSDGCPDLAEDADGFDDADGCPDPDNDGDGIVDVADACPLEPEDVDGFEDTDGCIDPDNDGDGLADAFDACPNEAETVDGWQDDDGCPDPDNDGDGRPDETDLCPNEPEELNGIRDDDGCPDAMKAVRGPDRILVWDGIQFRRNSARLEKSSDETLEAVAALLNASPDLRRLSVEGHTGGQGNSSAAKPLSKQRAEAVVAKLEALGVDGSRLQAVGLGAARPKASNRTQEGRKANERIEIRILEQAPVPVQIDGANPWNVPAMPSNPAGIGTPAPPSTGPVDAGSSPWGPPRATPKKPEVKTTPNPWGR